MAQRHRLRCGMCVCVCVNQEVKVNGSVYMKPPGSTLAKGSLTFPGTTQFRMYTVTHSRQDKESKEKFKKVVSLMWKSDSSSSWITCRPSAVTHRRASCWIHTGDPHIRVVKTWILASHLSLECVWYSKRCVCGTGRQVWVHTCASVLNTTRNVVVNNSKVTNYTADRGQRL